MRRTLCTCLAAAALCAAPAQHAGALPAEGVAPVNNREYGRAVRQIVQKARRNLRIMLYQVRYYPDHPDSVTNYLVQDLIDARKRGVDVEVLVDTGDWNPGGKNEYNTDFVDRLTTSGIEVWEDAATDVSHEKVVLADDAVTLISSNNWLFYSLERNNEVAAVIFSPPVNAWFGAYFEERKAKGRPRANTDHLETPQDAAAPGLTAADLPDLKPLPAADVKPIPNRLFYPTVRDLITHAKRRVVVLQRSFNLSPGQRKDDAEAALPGAPTGATSVLLEDLTAAKARGVDVTVILDQTEAMDDAANDETADRLKSRGIKVLRDDMAVQTHAKMLVVDDDKVVIGSTNWTNPAIEEGNEASVLLTGRELNKVYDAYVASILRSAAPYQATPRSIWDTPTTSPKKMD
jgi:phosphatidylserine/phosphatidylglycerophosphate/cardiolipin synthase-like enzyme